MKNKPFDETYKSCSISKQLCKPSQIPYCQNSAKRASKSGQDTHVDIAVGEKIVQTLGAAKFVMALNDDATDITETTF